MADYTAIYISANSFKVSGDVTDAFIATERVAVDCSGSLVYSSINSVSYAAGYTTIVLTQSVLTSPCGSCYPGGVYSGPTGNLPPHTHEDDNTGGSGVIGSPAQYEWGGTYGTEIRFKNPDGTWGSWVDLQGASAEWKGDWSGSSVPYERLNFVRDDDVVYVCIEDHTSDASSQPGVGAYWETYWTACGGGGSGDSIKIECSQTSHGFAVMDCVSVSYGSGFHKTDSSSYGDIQSFIGIVETVTDNDNFVLVPPGGTIATPGGVIGGITFAKGLIYYIGSTAGTLSPNNPYASNTSYYGLTALVGLDSINGTVQKLIYTPDLNVPDDVGGYLKYVSTTSIEWAFAKSNQIRLWNGNDEEVCDFVATMSISTSSTDMGSVAIAHSTYYDVFLLYNGSGNPLLKIAPWGDSTIGAAHRSINWQTSTAYKIGHRRNNDGYVYACISNHTSDASTEPGTGAYWETYGFLSNQ